MSIVLDDGRTRLVLAPVSQGGGLLQVRHGVHTWFVAEAARSKPPLWRLQLRNRADGSVLELCNVDVPARPGLTWEGSLPDGGPLAVRVLISQSETVEAVIHVHLVSRVDQRTEQSERVGRAAPPGNSNCVSCHIFLKYRVGRDQYE